MYISIVVVMASVVTSPSSFDCVGEYANSLDHALVHAVSQLDGLDEFLVSPQHLTISHDIATKCSEGDFNKLESLGVFDPENQIGLYAQAVFLVSKYGGDLGSFVRFLASDYSRWEKNQLELHGTANALCNSEFKRGLGRVQVWTPGQLIFRSYPVGVCTDDDTFWRYEASKGWQRLDPYERSEICTTLHLSHAKAYQYCIAEEQSGLKLRSGLKHESRQP